jgi:hypothetical protein
MPLIDVKSLDEEVEAEVQAERRAAAKGRLKKLKQAIIDAEKVVVNLKEEYATALRDIGGA